MSVDLEALERDYQFRAERPDLTQLIAEVRALRGRVAELERSCRTAGAIIQVKERRIVELERPCKHNHGVPCEFEMHIERLVEIAAKHLVEHLDDGASVLTSDLRLALAPFAEAKRKTAAEEPAL